MSALFKNEGAKRRPTTKIAGLVINRDLIRYREHYPSENINMPGRTSNLRFYKNQIRSVPDGDFIDEIHIKVCGVVNVLHVHAVYNHSNPPRVHEMKAQLYIFVDISVVWCSHVWACVHLLNCELSLPTSREHEDMIKGSGTRRSTYFEQTLRPSSGTETTGRSKCTMAMFSGYFPFMRRAWTTAHRFYKSTSDKPWSRFDFWHFILDFCAYLVQFNTLWPTHTHPHRMLLSSSASRRVTSWFSTFMAQTW